MYQPEISVVVTVFNEEKNIKLLFATIYDSLKDIEYELILVDDGSTDRTVTEAKTYANHRTRLLIFNKNYGQTTALAAGIDNAKGLYIATMDGDLQNDPSDIPMMLNKARG